MAKDLNMLCRSSSPNTPEVEAGVCLCVCVFSFVPSLKKRSFIFFIFMISPRCSPPILSSSLPGEGFPIFYFTRPLQERRALSVILSAKLHGSQKLWPCLERKCTRHTDKRGPALQGRTVSPQRRTRREERREGENRRPAGFWLVLIALGSHCSQRHIWEFACKHAWVRLGGVGGGGGGNKTCRCIHLLDKNFSSSESSTAAAQGWGAGGSASAF